MDDVARLREKAQQCFRLARGLDNQEVRANIEALGRELTQQADELEHEARVSGPRSRAVDPRH